MSQIQGPPPEIESVQSADRSLIVTWTMTPYTSGTTYDATLLVIDTTSNSMASILLNTTEIFEEEYTIENLINGNRYAILFSILNIDGITVNSNTVTGIPSDIPSRPTIVGYTLDRPSYTSVRVAVTLGPNTGLPATSLVFRICREDGTPVVTTQAFTAIDPSNTYTLVNDASNNPFEIGKDYIISCQALNVVGYGNVSNSINFKNGDVAARPVLGVIQSGSNDFALLPVSGNNTSSNDITSFKVYNNNSFLKTFPISPPITPGASYSLDLSLNNINNETGYSLSVTAITNSVIESLKSNTQTDVPALKLAFSNAAITFPANNEIRVDFSNNNASWLNTRVVTLSFSGVNIPPGTREIIFDPDVIVGTYVIIDATLVAGEPYIVIITGYSVVPTTLYDQYWAAPALADYKYNANALAVSRTYSAAPDPVTNISISTDIINGSGIAQASWTPGANNGSPITNYTCKLYTVDVSGNKTLLRVITTTDNNCTFENLLVVGILYSVGITENNSLGSSPEMTYEGILISGARVAGVTNLQGIQTFYNGIDFSGNLSWNYAGPGYGYTAAVFHIYSVENGIYSQLGTVNYDLSTQYYGFAVRLGNIANVRKEFAVNVFATCSTGRKSSDYGDIIVIPSGGPVISNVSVSQIDASTNWQVTFTVTNQTSAPMIQNGILSLVMPDPIEDIAGTDPIYNGYDVTLVDKALTRSHTYTHNLGYKAIGYDYVLITAVNTHGETVYGNRWGKP